MRETAFGERCCDVKRVLLNRRLNHRWLCFALRDLGGKRGGGRPGGSVSRGQNKERRKAQGEPTRDGGTGRASGNKILPSIAEDPAGTNISHKRLSFR